MINKRLKLVLENNNLSDRNWRYKILQQLAKWEIKSNLLAFLKLFLTNQILQVRNQDILSSIIQDNETPQKLYTFITATTTSDLIN